MPLSPNWLPFFLLPAKLGTLLLLAKLGTLLLLAKLGTLFGQYVGKHVGHHVHLHVSRYVSHQVGHRNVVSTLCEVSGTLTEWKSESMTDLRTTEGRTDVPG